MPGAFAVNQSFGVAVELSNYNDLLLRILPADGSIGIALSQSGNAFLDAISGQLEKPVLTLWQEQ